MLEYMDPKQDYILTRDLKSLSGAVLHKMVFVFRLAYIQAIQDKLGIKLPMILDSPSGREVEQVNVDDMMTTLARDFSENQIIIASVFDYPIMGEVNRIEIGDRLIDQPTQYNEN